MNPETLKGEAIQLFRERLTLYYTDNRPAALWIAQGVQDMCGRFGWADTVEQTQAIARELASQYQGRCAEVTL